MSIEDDQTRLSGGEPLDEHRHQRPAKDPRSTDAGVVALDFVVSICLGREE
jgi:hypothetical protein